MGAFYALRGLYPEQSRLYLKYGTAVGLVASTWWPIPPATSKPKWSVSTRKSLAAEGRFHSGPMAINMIGQPNVNESSQPDRDTRHPQLLVKGSFHGNVRGLRNFQDVARQYRAALLPFISWLPWG
jgi:hypothetical protein